MNAARCRIRNWAAAQPDRLVLDHDRKIEQITRADGLAAVPKLLGDNLHGCFDPHRAPKQRPGLEGLGREIGRRHQIDLPFRTDQLHKAGAFDIVRRYSLRNLAEPRRNIAQVLRAGQKDVDVSAAPMLVAKHQRCTAAESPERVVDSDGADLVDQAKRVTELSPFANAKVIRRLPVIAAASHPTGQTSIYSHRSKI